MMTEIETILFACMGFMLVVIGIIIAVKLLGDDTLSKDDGSKLTKSSTPVSSTSAKKAAKVSKDIGQSEQNYTVFAIENPPEGTAFSINSEEALFSFKYPFNPDKTFINDIMKEYTGLELKSKSEVTIGNASIPNGVFLGFKCCNSDTQYYIMNDAVLNELDNTSIIIH